jgi:glycosyltransferase involved in cell wall biosynthesis
LKKTNGPNKILMTTDNLGGVWTYTIELLSEFEKSGILTALAIMGRPLTDDHRQQLSFFNNVKVYDSTYKLEWMEDPWEEVDIAGEWLLNIRDEFHPDLIHLNSFSFGALNWGVPVVTVAHSDVLSWWKSVLNYPHPKRFNEYFKRVKNGLENSTYIIAPTKSMMSYLNEHYGEFKNQKVIYNGRKIKPYNIEKQCLIFSMGRIWDSAKNISLLINSAPMLKWKVRLAGNPQNPVTNELTLYGNVDFLGGLTEENVFDYLAESSIFVLPARYEPFGLSPLEAALSGCALVLGDIDSLREVWGDAALYVNPDDGAMLIEVVNNLISDKDLLKEFSMRAQEKAAEYSTRRMFSEYLKIYKTVLDRDKFYIKAH